MAFQGAGKSATSDRRTYRARSSPPAQSETTAASRSEEVNRREEGTVSTWTGEWTHSATATTSSRPEPPTFEIDSDEEEVVEGEGMMVVVAVPNEKTGCDDSEAGTPQQGTGGYSAGHEIRAGKSGDAKHGDDGKDLPNDDSIADFNTEDNDETDGCCPRLISIILLGLEIFDIVLDYLFAIRLYRDDIEKTWSIVLLAVTSIAACFAFRKLLGIPNGNFIGFMFHFFLEDATTIMIMATVYGAYDPTIELEVINLYTSISFGAIVIIMFCFRGEKQGIKPWVQGCGIAMASFVSTVGCFVVVHGRDDDGSEDGPILGEYEGLPWYVPLSFYILVGLFGLLTCCCSVCGGTGL